MRRAVSCCVKDRARRSVEGRSELSNPREKKPPESRRVRGSQRKEAPKLKFWQRPQDTRFRVVENHGRREVTGSSTQRRAVRDSLADLQDTRFVFAAQKTATHIIARGLTKKQTFEFKRRVQLAKAQREKANLPVVTGRQRALVMKRFNPNEVQGRALGQNVLRNIGFDERRCQVVRSDMGRD